MMNKRYCHVIRMVYLISVMCCAAATLLIALPSIVVEKKSIKGEEKTSQDVFAKWFAWQKVVEPVRLSMTQQEIVEKFDQLPSIFDGKPLGVELHRCIASYCSQKKLETTDLPPHAPLSKDTINNLVLFYLSLDQDMLRFIEHLKTLGFAGKHINLDELKSRKKDGSWNPVINKYTLVTDFFLAEVTEEAKLSKALTFANKLFTYCFEPQTFDHFDTLLSQKALHPIGRFLFSNIWYFLAGTGWRLWNAQALRNVKRDADSGKRICYIAGGVDIYQLLKHGIYNLDLIDPILPIQEKYYAEGWEWLWTGSPDTNPVGDKLTCPELGLELERTKHTNGETFDAMMRDGSVIKIPHSFTVWTVLKDGNQVGTITMDRRFCKQSDFDQANNKAFMISFNELYYVSNRLWGIDPRLFDNDISFHVKQLAQPVSKLVACNIHEASMRNKFKFIALGSCTNDK